MRQAQAACAMRIVMVVTAHRQIKQALSPPGFSP
jgi:hypothetical protein